jgi:hypothetical protein
LEINDLQCDGFPSGASGAGTVFLSAIKFIRLAEIF